MRVMVNEKPYIPKEVSIWFGQTTPTGGLFGWSVYIAGEFRKRTPRKLFGVFTWDVVDGEWTPLLEDMMEEVLRRTGRGLAVIAWSPIDPEREVRRLAGLLDAAGTQYRVIVQESRPDTSNKARDGYPKNSLFFELSASSGCETYYDLYDKLKEYGIFVDCARVFMSSTLDVSRANIGLNTSYEESEERLWTWFGKDSETVVNASAGFEILAQDESVAREVMGKLASIWVRHGAKVEIEDETRPSGGYEPESRR